MVIVVNIAGVPCCCMLDLTCVICVCVCVLKFCGKFLLSCIQLAIKALTNDEHQTTDGPGSISWSDGVNVCDSVARLFADWPQMRLV